MIWKTESKLIYDFFVSTCSHSLDFMNFCLLRLNRRRTDGVWDSNTRLSVQRHIQPLSIGNDPLTQLSAAHPVTRMIQFSFDSKTTAII